jgi:hypothetical protein
MLQSNILPATSVAYVVGGRGRKEKRRDRRLAEETAGSLCNAGWFLAIDAVG